jgi:hypothetical protein
MKWKPGQLLEDFLLVAELAGMKIRSEAINIEKLSRPHKPPSSLPKGKMAVYVFSEENRTLKVGKVGPRSQARYTSQHYNAGSVPGTLAASILKDQNSVARHAQNEANVSDWIKENTDRVNFILDVELGISVLTLLESFVQCRLRPVFEGFRSQR